jgi:hypothetical protein
MTDTLTNIATLVAVARETIALVREVVALARTVKVWIKRNRRS